MNTDIKENDFKKICNKAKEIRMFYKMAKKYNFKKGNPEIIGYEKFNFPAK